MTEIEICSLDGGVRRVGTVSGARSAVLLPPVEPGILRYAIEAAEDVVRIRWTWPAEAVTLWRPKQGTSRDLPTDWWAHRDVRSVRSAPVAALVDARSRTPLTVSLSTSVRGCDFAVGVNEESAEHLVELTVDDIEPGDGARRLTLRVDLRGLHFAQALREVTAEWTAELGDRIVPVPALARQAMYSTWYSDHQHVSAASVEAHARASTPYGCQAVIVDDGWQTDDTARGYAYCGDWEPTSSKFPDMAAHVQRVHELGMAYVLWIAPPMIGARSKAWDRLKDKTLGPLEADGKTILDPRHPDVRAHLVECCVRPVRDWGVDGLKIDFIDTWACAEPPATPGIDCESVDEGAERFLAAVTDELRRLRPDVLIEFRQDYVNPRLWQFGTFLRANDCAMDPVENRVRTLDSRLLAGDRAVHADMLEWHEDASAEAVGLQLINTMFSTPQVSVDLDVLPAHQAQAVTYWLGFLRDQADTLLHGKLTPSRPDARYTQVRADGASGTVVTVFSDPLVRLGPSDHTVTVVNGGSEARVLVDGMGPGLVELVVSDCTGTEVLRTTTPASQLWAIDVPVAGVARLQRG